MDNKDNVNNVNAASGSFLSKLNFKKIGAGLLVCAVAAGGFSWYNHNQRIADFHRVAEAKTRIVETQAEKNNVELIDKAQVRSIAAETMGVDESNISFDEVFLTDGSDGMFVPRHGHGRGYGHGPYCGEGNRDGYCDDDRRRGPRDGYGCYNNGYRQGEDFSGRPFGQRFQGETPSNDRPQRRNIMNRDNVAAMPEASVQKLAEGQTAQEENNKVERPGFHPVYHVLCESGNVKYNLNVDAVTGDVYRCQAGGRRF
ncbi:MAG: hypothetical protein K6C05_02090 [Anaerovibrio sp.]|uniref:hypothetical protein n=1 Tax=Anaerovibrio sp. TaxID=1872532 RepID=UPI0025CC215B|nr:hypothetical protein [Anaerovibrio sp.]MCR5175622.1 hypothetical protein [Anaerovibrio sp.]